MAKGPGVDPMTTGVTPRPASPPTLGGRTKYAPVNLSQVLVLPKNCTAHNIAMRGSAIQCNAMLRNYPPVMIAMVMKVMIGAGE